MPNYAKLYIDLFAAIADAVEHIEQQNYGLAKDGLIRAMQEAEEIYLNEK